MERQNLQNLAIVASFVFIFFFSLLVQAGQGWVLSKESEGIKVYTREVPDSNFKEFKGEMLVKTKVEALVALVTDSSACPRWIDTCVEGRLLKEVSENERYAYTLSKAPWPVSNRDAVTHSIIKKDDKTGVVTISIEAVPDYIPEKEGVVRVKMIKGMWQFIPKENGFVEVAYQVHNDPGGSLPSWLVNSVAVSQPYNTLLNMKKIVKDYE